PTDTPPPSPLLAALGYDPLSLDALAELSATTAAEVAVELTELEVQGWVARMDDGRYQRIR
ncbi:DNA-protecting protein DprA, partial [Bordetella holmesii]|nr:DNA-protecting protein DprA [Bordetella holmesii]MBO1262219.1 DNA-protecting protein DprA [Bordetella holmesii]